MDCLGLKGYRPSNYVQCRLHWGPTVPIQGTMKVLAHPDDSQGIWGTNSHKTRALTLNPKPQTLNPKTCITAIGQPLQICPEVSVNSFQKNVGVPFGAQCRHDSWRPPVLLKITILGLPSIWGLRICAILSFLTGCASKLQPLFVNLYTVCEFRHHLVRDMIRTGGEVLL